MKDKNRYEIKHGQNVKFIRPDETVEVIGEVVDIFERSILVQDEETDTYEVLPSEVEVQMNMRCTDCGWEFNQEDAGTLMLEGIGKTLYEAKCCPHCHSTDIEEKSNTKIIFGLYAIWGEAASDLFEDEGKINMSPKEGAVNYYSFDTRKERDAFLLGANEANGWNEYSFLNEENSKVVKKTLLRKRNAK